MKIYMQQKSVCRAVAAWVALSASLPAAAQEAAAETTERIPMGAVDFPELEAQAPVVRLPRTDARAPKSVALRVDRGQIMKTNDYLKEAGLDMDYSALSLKYTVGVPGNSWENIDSHKPYDGIAIYVPQIEASGTFGHPFSIYLLHGGSLWELNQRMHLMYEWNAGYSTGWKHYHPIDHPANITIGSAENAHVGFNLFFQWQAARHFEIKVGGGLTHFSNGATHLPNKGMNMWAPMVEVAYRWDDPSYTFSRHTSAGLQDIYSELRSPADHEKHIQHQVALAVSKRQVYMDTLGSGLNNEYYDHSFRVLQLSYCPLYMPVRKFGYGPSLDVVYDESSNARVVEQSSYYDSKSYSALRLAPARERFQVGLSMRGEMRTYRFSFFGHLGYDLVHPVEETSRFYQIFGFKFQVTPHLFLASGIRAVRFSKAQFIPWTMAYTFDSKPWFGRKK